MKDQPGTIYVVTAGVSIRGNLAKLERWRADDPDGAVGRFADDCLSCIGEFPARPDPMDDAAEAIGLKRASRQPSRQAAGRESDAEPSGQAGACKDGELLRRITERLDPDTGVLSTRGFSAETSSLFADGAPHPHPGDHIVLISSDTEIGLRCASLIAGILSRYVHGAARRVDVGTVSDGLPSGLPCLGPAASDTQRADAVAADSENMAVGFAAAGVTVAVVGGLTADAKYAVERSGWGIARVLGSAYASAHAAGRRLVLHPIGGYKATIPVLTALASHLPTEDGADVQMWSNHEQTPIGLRQPLQRTGVPDDEYWDLQDLARIAGEDGRRGIDPRVRLRSARWDGYAWYRDDDREWRLTPIGRSILELRVACLRMPPAVHDA